MSEKTKLRRSLFIGLGGTGVKTILKTKTVLMDNYRQGEELPPLLGFLGIDTDANEYEKTQDSKDGKVKLSKKERYSIGVENPRGYFSTYKRDFTWMANQNQIFINTLDRGAGQIRTNGRLAFMFHREQLRTKLYNALTDLQSASIDDEKWKKYEPLGSESDGNAKIEVHLIFSFSGGTGCGTFLDVAYLIREVAEKNNFNITLNAYGVLPGVFKQEIRNTTDKSRVEPNAYGALRDLDYLMGMNPGENAFRLNWGNDSYETDIQPFDSVVLIDNKNAEGLTYRNMSDLTEMLALALLATTGQIGDTAQSVGDNVKNDMTMKAFDIADKRAWVAAVGAAAIIYNSEDVAKVYALKMQNKIINQLLAAKEDANNLANEWINNVKIAEHEKDDVIDRLYDMSQIAGFNITDKDFDRRNVKEKINNKVEQYYTAFEPSNNDWDKTVEEFFATVSASLTEKVIELANENKSVGLANEFLKEVKSQIENIFLQEMREEQKQWEADKQNADAELQSQIENLQMYLSKGMFHGKTENYLTVIRSSAQDSLTARIEVKRRAYAQSFYSLLIEYLNKELKQVEENVRKLNAIKDNNDLEIQQIQNCCGKNHVVEFDLADERLRKIEASEKEIPLSEFINLLPTQSVYDNNSQDTLKKALEQYTFSLKQYKTILSEDIDTMLDGMSADDFNDVVCRAFNRSKPFLQIADGGYKLSNGMPIGKEELFYICVPDVKTNRLTRDDYYREIISADHANVLPTGLHDRIIIYRQKRPIPAFAITGLEPMRVTYEKDMARVSFHVDEDLRKKMIDENFSFYPKDKDADEALETWVKGCILGLIKFDKQKGVYTYFDESKQIKGAGQIWENLHTAYRDKAFEVFAKNTNLFKQYDDRFRAYLDELGTSKVQELAADVQSHYFEKYSQCQLTKKTVFGENVGMEYTGTRQMFKQEGEIIENLFAR